MTSVGVVHGEVEEVRVIEKDPFYSELVSIFKKVAYGHVIK